MLSVLETVHKRIIRFQFMDRLLSLSTIANRRKTFSFSNARIAF